MLSRNSTSSVRSGFTLVELLVVIAIIGVMVGLLLPAVQAAREAARRMSCGNNLKQIGIALHNYHDTYKTFPPDAIWHGNPRGTTPSALTVRNYTWITMILPFMEQSSLHGQINFNFPALQQFDNLVVNGVPARGLMIPSLQCPSDYVWDQAPRGFGTTSYAGNGGWAHHRYKRTDVQRAGVFPLYDGVRLSDITDGTSNTAMVAEVTTRGYTKPAAPHRSAGGVGILRNTSSAVIRSAFIAPFAWHGWNEASLADIGKGHLHTADGFAVGAWGNANNYGSPHHILLPLYWWHHAINNDWPGPASMHPGGAQFTLADASVRFIAETIAVGRGAEEATNGNFWSLGIDGNIYGALHNISGNSLDTIVTLD